MQVGFIGAGNMASAIIGGMIEKKKYEASQIMASGKDDEQFFLPIELHIGSVIPPIRGSVLRR